MELKILKACIKINLANWFIKLFKSPAKASIFFDYKPNQNFNFCINYYSFNNLTIKNRYLLFLINKLFDCPGQAKQYI